MHLERLISLLEVIAVAGRPLTAAEIQRATGLPKPSCYRLIQSLVDQKLVDQPAEDGKVIIGERLIRISGRNSPWRRRHAWCPKCQPEGKTEVDLARAAKLLALHPCREIIDIAQGRLIADVSQPVRAKQSTARYGGRRSMR